MRSFIVRGTSPSKSSINFWDIPRSAFVFCRKKPVDLMSCWSSSSSTLRYASGVGYFLNSMGVTVLTIASVDCADRIVATTHSSGVV
jgi:hypothetical protein